MPLLKTIRSIEPLWRDWDRKAQKSGLRSTMYSGSGDQYTGEWRNNLMHGKGKYVYKKANAIYQGDWICGMRSGYGTYAVKDATTEEYIRVYAGYWMNDKKHGYGTYYYSDDEYYEGGWECGKRSGWGKMLYTNGDIYEGEWHNNKCCGLGMLFLGRIYDGVWVKDIPKCGTLEDADCSEALNTEKLPIPEVKVANPKEVLEEVQRSILQEEKRKSDAT
ncbi:MORN repeat-containing protein 3-like isoform X2 [Hyla sarda]|uniref:MORN repeat-containing protein 3-like isoform X2 n=1 Tax=Hyla sarda TaxID=327740 RepID=UPI0024C34A5F|nr:MORN repeat-containing protein 3-like isoform X2 [Hyla sarda]